MLVVSQSSGSNTATEKPTEKHLFAMSTFKVETIPTVVFHLRSLKTVPKPKIFCKGMTLVCLLNFCEVLIPVKTRMHAFSVLHSCDFCVHSDPRADAPYGQLH